jgi:prolyl 4-hydroxylase
MTTVYEEPCKIMESFLEPEKCQYLIHTYQDRCKRSTVVDALGRDVVDAARTSSTYFMPNDDAVIVELRRKTAAMVGVPESHVEGLQLVRYAKGEQYKFHYDYFDAIRNNQREHTFLVYLNDFSLEDGGSTIFKEYGIKVYPKTGRCIWFRNMIDGKLNTKSLHSGEEVLSDKIKFAVNIWIRQKPVNDYSRIQAEVPIAQTTPYSSETKGTSKATNVPLWNPTSILRALVILVIFILLSGVVYLIASKGKLTFPTFSTKSFTTLFRR